MKDFAFDKESPVSISINTIQLEGILHIPSQAKGVVLFAHGSGSSRFSIRNQQVAKVLNQGKLATLLFDLLTPQEEKVDEYTRQLRFDIPLLASRLAIATDWISQQRAIGQLPIGYFGASTGGGAALIAAAHRSNLIKAVVSRGGRPDLAGECLSQVKAPTLLIVGGDDDVVIQMNQAALVEMRCIKKLEIIPGATHLFEEPGTLEEVTRLTKAWFVSYLV